MNDFKPKGKQYYEAKLEEIIGALRSIQSFDMTEYFGSLRGIELIHEMRKGVFGYELDLIEEIMHLEKGSEEQACAEKLWEDYKRVAQVQNTINWYYGDHLERERLLFFRTGHYKPGEKKSADKEKAKSI